MFEEGIRVVLMLALRFDGESQSSVGLLLAVEDWLPISAVEDWLTISLSWCCCSRSTHVPVESWVGLWSFVYDFFQVCLL